MVIKKSPCKNHPDALTSKKCHHCRAFICKTCQRIYRHHIYCGVFCAFKDFLHEKYSGFSKEFKILFILIILTNLGTYLLVNNQKDERIAIRAESESAKRIQPHFIVDTTFNALRTSFQISGETNQESVILLERDGRYISTALSKKGSYEFPEQELYQGENKFSVYGIVYPDIITKIDSFTVSFSSERILNLARSVDKIITNHLVCALTFDAGSEAVGADSILWILKEKGVCVTIFLTGLFIKRYPDLVNQIVKDGHEYANHTYTHPHMTTYVLNGNHLLKQGINRNFIHQQLLKTDSVFLSLTGQNLYKFWRSPFGEYNRDILLWAAEIGYLHIGWSQGGDTRDWVTDPDDPLYLTSEQIKERILALAEKNRLQGNILLMHLNSSRIQDFPYRILGELIDSLREKGYEFMTVSQLLHLQHSS